MTASKFIYPIIAFLIFSLHGCQYPFQDQQKIILSGMTMGTTYTVKINTGEIKLDRIRLSAEINQQLNNINRQMSTYLETSSISLFNQATTTDWINIPFETYTVIKEALKISQLTNNAFDITIGPIVNLWGFGPVPQSNLIPDSSTIHEALDQVGSQYINIRSKPYSIRKTKAQLAIDLSAIAKGFAVDLIADYLDKLEINNYIVEIGGEIKSKGVNFDNTTWRIGIEKPIDDQRTVQMIINLDNIAMATSGDYRNYFEKNGIRYSHTIDPTTGKPSTKKLASVTVLHPSAMTADAMATALLVLGHEAGLNLARKENLAALFIVREKNYFIEKTTPQFRHYLIPAKE